MREDGLSSLPDHRPYLAFAGFVAKSQSSLVIKDLIHRLASLSVSVLLTGESGTGKTTIAHVIHGTSQRRESQIVTFSCAALSEEMEAAELFGVARGVGSAAGRH
jgi:transcriptional regulator with PAS, ATPase and Fis domain